MLKLNPWHTIPSCEKARAKGVVKVAHLEVKVRRFQATSAARQVGVLSKVVLLTVTLTPRITLTFRSPFLDRIDE